MFNNEDNVQLSRAGGCGTYPWEIGLFSIKCHPNITLIALLFVSQAEGFCNKGRVKTRSYVKLFYENLVNKSISKTKHRNQ